MFLDTQRSMCTSQRCTPLDSRTLARAVDHFLLLTFLRVSGEEEETRMCGLTASDWNPNEASLSVATTTDKLSGGGPAAESSSSLSSSSSCSGGWPKEAALSALG